MDKQKKILLLLATSIIDMSNAEYMLKVKKSLENQNNSINNDEFIELARENKIGSSYIDAAINIFNAMEEMDNKEHKEGKSLYDYWSELNEEEKAKLISHTYSKQNKLYEARLLGRETPLVESEDLNRKNIEVKLSKNCDLLKNEKLGILDTDFLRTFSVGTIRYFLYNYLFLGKDSHMEKQVVHSEVFNSLKRIIDEDNLRFESDSRYQNLHKKFNKPDPESTIKL